MDKEKIEAGIKLVLEGIGEDLQREGLKETPGRIARMYEELFAGMQEDAAEHLKKTFSLNFSSMNDRSMNNYSMNDSSMDTHEMVLEKDIVFYSTCEHHMLPFYGKAHIAYIPDGRVVGLSKLARTVEVYARRLQIQEQMTGQIADAVMEHLKPKGVMVAIEAEHMCMTMRGIKKPGSQTVTFVSRGIFKEEPRLQEQFLCLIHQ